MVAQAETPRLIESYYTLDELETATPGRRLGGYLLDLVIIIVTLLTFLVKYYLLPVAR